MFLYVLIGIKSHFKFLKFKLSSCIMLLINLWKLVFEVKIVFACWESKRKKICTPSLPLPEVQLSEFWQENLFCDAETFSSCSFVPRRNLNVSAVSLLHLKLPWQQNFDMQLKSNFGFFWQNSRCFSLQNYHYFKFHSYSFVLIFHQFWFWSFCENCEIQNGRSKMADLMTPWPTKVKQVGGYLLNAKQFYLILLQRKPSRGPDAYPKNCEMQNFVPIISLPESNPALLKISPAQTLERSYVTKFSVISKMNEIPLKMKETLK